MTYEQSFPCLKVGLDVLQSHPDILGKPHAGMTERWRLLSHVLKQQEQQQYQSEASLYGAIFLHISHGVSGCENLKFENVQKFTG